MIMVKEYLKKYKYCKNKRYDTLAGTLSFFFILSFVPLLYLCLNLYVKIGTRFNLEIELPSVIQNYISFDLNAGVSIFFILTTIYSASKFFTQLRKTGEIVYDIKKPRVTIKTQVLSCVLVIMLMVIVSAGLLLMSLCNTFLKYSWAKALVTILTYLVFLLMLYGFLCLINKTACQLDVRIRELNKGIIFSLIYVTIVSAIFIVYVTSFADFEKLYGVFSTIVIAFLYVFLMMKGIVMGIISNEKRLKNK